MPTLALLSALLAVSIQVPPGPSPRPTKADRGVPEIGAQTELVELDVVVTAREGPYRSSPKVRPARRWSAGACAWMRSSPATTSYGWW
ncbi:MAG TPA: hypothetical protein VGN09_21070 [Vicinamibacteria bacterium]